MKKRQAHMAFFNLDRNHRNWPREEEPLKSSPYGSGSTVQSQPKDTELSVTPPHGIQERTANSVLGMIVMAV